MLIKSMCSYSKVGRSALKTFLVTCLAVGFSLDLRAGDFEWSGVYRIEGYQINNPGLTSKGSEKAYGLHHLSLKPKIVAGDGLTLRAQLDLFNSTRFPNSQMGTIWGDGVGSASTSVDSSNVLAQNQKSEQLKISLMYLTLVQEFGALIAGRAPIHFGLGMTHNAGRDPFDHWMDTSDLVGYKIVVGNLYFLPMYGKVNEGKLSDADEVSDLFLQVGYDNVESGLEMGFMYQSRTAGGAGNDAVIGAGALGGAGATATENVSITNYNLFVRRGNKKHTFGLEAGWQSGDTGVRTAAAEKVELAGFGLAAEYEYRPESSKWKFGVNLGSATGDDPDTNKTYEGYIFDRNYDVAFMLFNHGLGQRDFLKTQLLTGDGTTAVGDRLDDEAISNVTYFSPTVTYDWRDRWQLQARLTTGILRQDPLSGITIAKDLGYEFDFAVHFKPNSNVVWTNEIGLFSPGSAFKGDTLGLDNNFAYGLVTKAAISF